MYWEELQQERLYREESPGGRYTHDHGWGLHRHYLIDHNIGHPNPNRLKRLRPAQRRTQLGLRQRCLCWWHPASGTDLQQFTLYLQSIPIQALYRQGYKQMLGLWQIQCTPGMQGCLSGAIQLLRWHLCHRVQRPGSDEQPRQLRQRKEQVLEPIQRLREGQCWSQRWKQMWQLWVRVVLDLPSSLVLAGIGEGGIHV